VTGLEEAVAAELLRLASELLPLDGSPPSYQEPLAARLDSLQRLTLAVAVEDRFQIVLSDDDAAGADTLAAVARLVVQRASPRHLPPLHAAEPR
jgi:acyl carrier protein